MHKFFPDWLDLDPKKLSQVPPKREHTYEFNTCEVQGCQWVKGWRTCRWGEIAGRPRVKWDLTKLKWVLGSITMNKASGGDGIPVEQFQILKNNSLKMLHSICQQIWKTQQWPQDWKRSVFILIPETGNAKECSNHHTIALISLLAK